MIDEKEAIWAEVERYRRSDARLRDRHPNAVIDLLSDLHFIVGEFEKPELKPYSQLRSRRLRVVRLRILRKLVRAIGRPGLSILHEMYLPISNSLYRLTLQHRRPSESPRSDDQYPLGVRNLHKAAKKQQVEIRDYQVASRVYRLMSKGVPQAKAIEHVKKRENLVPTPATIRSIIKRFRSSAKSRGYADPSAPLTEWLSGTACSDQIEDPVLPLAKFSKPGRPSKKGDL